MGKKTKNNSHRLKTSHKKALVKRKTAYTRVDPTIAKVNDFIDSQIGPTGKIAEQNRKVELESISFDELRTLLAGPAVRKRPTKLSVDDANYLQPLLKRWGDNYERMAKDVKLNRMQWTAKQIQNKHNTYKLLLSDTPQV